MKRLSISLLLAVLTVCAVTGCGKKSEIKEEPVRMEVVPIEETTEEVEVPAKDYSKGSLNGNTYSSSWLEMSFDAPSKTNLSVINLEDSSLSEGKKILSQTFSEETINETVSNVECEMICVAEDSKANVSVIVEHMGDAAIAPEAYLAALKSNLSTIDTKAIAYSIVEDITSAQLAGNSYKKLTTRITSGDDSLIQEYLVRSKDSEIVGVIFTYPDTEAGRNDYRLLYDGFK